MNGENRLLKWIVVIVPVVGAVLAILPPQDRLKGGIDLVGGCSLLYEIDTTGLERDQIRGLSGRVISVLQRRVDPNAAIRELASFRSLAASKNSMSLGLDPGHPPSM